MNLKEHEELNTEVMEILKNEHFRENMIPYVVSILLMPKEDGTSWMCVDNRTMALHGCVLITTPVTKLLSNISVIF